MRCQSCREVAAREARSTFRLDLVGAEPGLITRRRDPDGGLPADSAVAVKLLADVLIRLDDVKGYLRDHGIVDPKSKQLRESVIALESRLRNEAQDHADALAMGPRAKVKLGLDIARGIDLASAMSEPDPERRAELLREAGVEEEGDE
jgi:hypothetical protein